MALRSCGECSAQISTSAPSCPHCGAPVPRKANRGCAGIIIILFCGLGFLTWYENKPLTDQDKLCRADWSKCKDNSDLVNNYLSNYEAQNSCKTEALRQAKYGEPKFPMLFFFGTFLTGDDYPKTGVATLKEKGAQYQNNFGAMVNSEVTCTYDLRAKRVRSVTVSPR